MTDMELFREWEEASRAFGRYIEQEYFPGGFVPSDEPARAPDKPVDREALQEWDRLKGLVDEKWEALRQSALKKLTVESPADD